MSYGRNIPPNYIRMQGADIVNNIPANCQSFVNSTGQFCGADASGNINCAYMTPWQRLIEKYRQCLTKSAQQALDNGAMALVPHVIYSSKPIVANTKFFEAADTEVPTYRNLNQQKLAAGQVFVGMALRFGTAVQTPPAVGSAYYLQDADYFASAIDPVVANGELKIQENQKPYLYTLPCTVFTTGANAMYRGLFELPAPMVFNEKLALEVEHLVQSGQTITTDLVGRFEIWGLITRDNYIQAINS